MVAATENLNQSREEEDRDVKSFDKMEQKGLKYEENPDQGGGEIGSEERSSHETPGVDDVQPNEEEGDKDEKSCSQTLSDCGDTRVCNSMTLSLFVK